MFPLPSPSLHPKLSSWLFSEKQRWANKWCKRKNLPARRSYFWLQIQWMNCPPACREKPRSDISNECRRETTAPPPSWKGPWTWNLSTSLELEAWAEILCGALGRALALGLGAARSAWSPEMAFPHVCSSPHSWNGCKCWKSSRVSMLTGRLIL